MPDKLRWHEFDPPSYDVWLLKVEARHSVARQRGVEFELIRLDPDQFAAWCKVKGCTPGEAARAAALAKRPR